MLKFGISIALFFIIIAPVQSQKVLQKEWDATGIEKLVIASDEVFGITISAEKTDKIRVYTNVEGETYENVVLRTSEDEKTLTIKTDYSPYFEKFDDKLAAHKVLAIDMTVILPENLMAEISSSIASVNASGNFEDLSVSLRIGNCDVHNFKGNATLHTRKGYVNVRAMKGVSGSASSRHGTVANTLPKQGKYHIKAESIDGAITLLPTQ